MDKKRARRDHKPARFCLRNAERASGYKPLRPALRRPPRVPIIAQTRRAWLFAVVNLDMRAPLAGPRVGSGCHRYTSGRLRTRYRASQRGCRGICAGGGRARVHFFSPFCEKSSSGSGFIPVRFLRRLPARKAHHRRQSDNRKPLLCFARPAGNRILSTQFPWRVARTSARRPFRCRCP